MRIHLIPLLMGLLLVPATLSAQSSFPLSLESLSKRSWQELECLYRSSTAGELPSGEYRGRAVYCKGRLFWRARTRMTRFLWRGKHFYGDRIVNQWIVGETLEGEVRHDTSWMDGGESITLDYRSTSWLWRDVRDEIREVAPGVWIGLMYQEKRCRRKIKAFFILEAVCDCGD